MKHWIFYGAWWAIGILFCVTAVVMLQRRLAYERNFVRLDGRLESYIEFPQDRGILRNPQFTFRSSAGEKISFRSDLGHVWLEYTTGERVIILHDPQSGRAAIAGFAEFYFPVIVTAMFGVGMLVGAAAPLLF